MLGEAGARGLVDVGEEGSGGEVAGWGGEVGGWGDGAGWGGGGLMSGVF